jgi:hypothetical protein
MYKITVINAFKKKITINFYLNSGLLFRVYSWVAVVVLVAISALVISLEFFTVK